ncbi:MAG: helix-turn-helix domain-containing protein [Kangiellaceae bacterium]|nr:helix-turn-helix domain-containing protein [Kangiellaceae bacterium]
MNKEELAANADWSGFEKRPTWGTVTTRELAEILGTSHQNVANWHLRGHLPEPEPRRKGGGNKNRWKVSTIKNWLCGTPEDETHWAFINTHMTEGFESIEQAIWNAERYWRVYQVERT